MSEGEASGRADRDRLRPAQVGGDRQRVDDDAWIEQVVRIEESFDLAEGADRLVRMLDAEEFGPRSPVAVLAGGGTAVLRDESPGLHDEIMEDLDAVGAIKGEVRAHVHAAVPEMTVGQTAHTVGGHQLVLVAQVVAEHLGRHRGIFPSGPGGIAVFGASGQSARIGADAPQGARLFAGGQDAEVIGAGIGGDDLGICDRFVRVGAGDLDEQPALACRQFGHGVLALVIADHVHEPRVDAFDGERSVGRTRGTASAASNMSG